MPTDIAVLSAEPAGLGVLSARWAGSAKDDAANLALAAVAAGRRVVRGSSFGKAPAMSADMAVLGAEPAGLAAGCRVGAQVEPQEGAGHVR